MDKSDEYRAKAAECQRMADRSLKEADKAQWLQLAHSWLTLLHNCEPNHEGQHRAHPTTQQQQPQRRN